MKNNNVLFSTGGDLFLVTKLKLFKVPIQGGSQVILIFYFIPTKGS